MPVSFYLPLLSFSPRCTGGVSFTAQSPGLVTDLGQGTQGYSVPKPLNYSWAGARRPLASWEDSFRVLPQWFSTKGNSFLSEIFLVVTTNGGKEWGLLASNGYRPGMLLPVLQCTGQLPHPQQRISQSKTLMVWRLRNAVLDDTLESTCFTFFLSCLRSGKKS